MNVHSQCSRTCYHDKPPCTALRASSLILHRYSELSAANFHFMLPYCLLSSSYQVRDQQWYRNLFEPVANFTERERLEWTAAMRWFVRVNLNTRTLMPRVLQVATLLLNLGARQREVALKQIDIILSLRSLVHITSEIEIPDEKTMRCFLPPMMM
jgi:hypothetical protein